MVGITVDKTQGLAPRITVCPLCAKELGIAMPNTRMPGDAYRKWLEASERREPIVEAVPCEDCRAKALPAFCAICDKIAVMLQGGCQSKLKNWVPGCKIVADSCQQCAFNKKMKWENVGLKCIPNTVSV